MSLEGARHIKFVSGYGHSPFPFQHLVMDADKIRIASPVVPDHFWIAANERGKPSIHWKEDRPAGEIFAKAVFRPDFTGQPLDESLAYIKETELPILELSFDGSSRVYYPSSYRFFEPFVGRLYEIFTSDCYSLVREYLVKALGHPPLPMGEVQEAYRRSHEMGRDFLGPSFREYGYEEVAKAQPGDIIVMGSKGSPTHVAVLLENNDIIHHHPGRLSCVEPYADYWLNGTTMILRYRGKSL